MDTIKAKSDALISGIAKYDSSQASNAYVDAAVVFTTLSQGCAIVDQVPKDYMVQFTSKITFVFESMLELLNNF